MVTFSAKSIHDSSAIIIRWVKNVLPGPSIENSTFNGQNLNEQITRVKLLAREGKFLGGVALGC